MCYIDLIDFKHSDAKPRFSNTLKGDNWKPAVILETGSVWLPDNNTA